MAWVFHAAGARLGLALFPTDRSCLQLGHETVGIRPTANIDYRHIHVSLNAHSKTTWEIQICS